MIRIFVICHLYFFTTIVHCQSSMINEINHHTPELWDPGDNVPQSDYFEEYSDLSQEKKHREHTEKKSCKTCQGVKMSEDELTALRIEFVKNQILKKLRLSERPQVSVEDLPRPVTETMLPLPEVDNRNRQLEDYYAKTTKKFIFLQEGRC